MGVSKGEPPKYFDGGKSRKTDFEHPLQQYSRFITGTAEHIV